MPEPYSIFSSGLTGMTFAGAAILIFLIIVLLILNRFKKNSRKDSLATGAGLNLLELKKKGLLSPEEMERVSNSIVKQMALKEQAERRRDSVPTTENLLLDPEVRRLETLAALGKKNVEKPAENGTLTKAGLPPTAPVQQNVGAPDAAPSQPEDLSTVELPLDVVQLIDAGLLSPEEVDNVKRRIIAKRQQK